MKQRRRPSNTGVKRALNYARHMSGESLACHWCRVPMRLRFATVDHVIPRGIGGSRRAGNAVLACDTCNQIRAVECNLLLGLRPNPKTLALIELRYQARLQARAA